jgi:ABC-type Fe3+-hydroxamate transport system substrate-binding protein
LGSASRSARSRPSPAARAPQCRAGSLPTVASINLCADQHVLALADPEQIQSVSWLAADPEESSFAAEAARFTLNYGTAEELLAFDPDVVMAGTYTSPFTRALLQRLGYRVVELTPENSIDDIERNLRLVGEAIGQTERSERAIAALRERLRTIEARDRARRGDRRRAARRFHGRRQLAHERSDAASWRPQRGGGTRP